MRPENEAILRALLDVLGEDGQFIVAYGNQDAMDGVSIVSSTATHEDGLRLLVAAGDKIKRRIAEDAL